MPCSIRYFNKKLLRKTAAAFSFGVLVYWGKMVYNKYPDYESAISADMAIGKEYKSGVTDQYDDPNSILVQAQANAHGVC